MAKKDKTAKKEGAACSVKTSIGGQALIEGIMMRGPVKTAMATRRADGSITLDSWETGKKPKFAPLEKAKADSEKAKADIEQASADSEKAKADSGQQNDTPNEEKPSLGAKIVKVCSKIPFVRGIFMMGSSMSLGYKCLTRSADIMLADTPEDEPRPPKNPEKAAKKEAKEKAKAEKAAKKAEKSGKPIEAKKGEDALTGVVSAVGSLLGVLLAVGLFILLPTYISKWILQLCGVDYSAMSYSVTTLRSAIEGIIKVVIMVLYMWGVSKMKDIRRTFMYHGAEHKTIFCYEAGLELTVENVRAQKRQHPRCGTSFLTLTVLVSIIVGIFIPPFIVTWLRVLIKLALLPLTMGISYELIKIAGRHDNVVTRIISAPGMWLQNITTIEPEDGMIECAIEAMKEVIPADGSDKIS